MKFGGLYLLNEAPPVVALHAFPFDVNALYDLLARMEPASRAHACALFAWPWYLPPWKRDAERFVAELRERAIEAWFLCPTEEQRGFVTAELGGNALHVSESCFIDEHRFRVVASTPRRFDAIYAAQMMRFKRIELAARIPRLQILTYDMFRPPPFDLAAFCPEVSHAHWNRFKLDDPSPMMQESHVGLALSAEEGPNLASVEYMLCGLPVVSTPSRGGRDEFFDPGHVFLCEPTPEAVARAVGEMLHAALDPHRIREATLRRLALHRERLVRFLFERGGGSRHAPETPEAIYTRLFCGPRGTFRHFVTNQEIRADGFDWRERVRQRTALPWLASDPD